MRRNSLNRPGHTHTLILQVAVLQCADCFLKWEQYGGIHVVLWTSLLVLLNDRHLACSHVNQYTCGTMLTWPAQGSTEGFRALLLGMVSLPGRHGLIYLKTV